MKLVGYPTLFYSMTQKLMSSIAGTMRYAELRPDLPAYLFPASSRDLTGTTQANGSLVGDSASIRVSSGDKISPETLPEDDFGGSQFEDQDMIAVGMLTLSRLSSRF